MAEKFNLEDVFRMMNPIGLSGNVAFAKHASPDAAITQQILDITINTDSAGVYDSTELLKNLNSFLKNLSGDSTSNSDQRKQFLELFRLYTSEGSGYLDGDEDPIKNSKEATDFKGTDVTNATFDNIMGGTGRLGLDDEKKKASIILSSSPFIHPSVRNTARVETFLNSIPSIVLSRCVPYLDVEFQFERPWISIDTVRKLKAAGLLKFLLGTGDDQLTKSANAAMYDAHTRVDSKNSNSVEHIFAGSELFTSPQLLTNVNPVGQNNRYVDVLDPFRPLMSLQGVEISIAPSVGMFTKKRAKLSLKLHDRSRLGEISDLIKPEVYSRTTVWLTYGWQHPEEVDNPYAEFINQMKAREAYGIVNASYAFDHVGGVTISLELFTRGSTEALTLKLHESPQSYVTRSRDLQQLYQDWVEFRQDKSLDEPSGTSRDIRPIQILDGALRGNVFDFKNEELVSAIAAVRKAIKQGGQVSSEQQEKLLKELKNFPKDVATISSTIRSDIDAKFHEARTGLDPFFPSIDDKSNHAWGSLAAQWNRGSDKAKKGEKRVVSFAKLFATFILPALATIKGIDDIQIFFYALNDHAGPASGTNIGEFPIEMPVLLSHWRDHVTRASSTENLTMEEFLGVLVDCQINDVRSLAYGLRGFYGFKDGNIVETKATNDPELIAKETEFEQKFGAFNKPVIEMFMETLTSHAPKQNSTSSAKLNLTDSAANPKSDPSKLPAESRILRIHIYDKQAHPFQKAAQLLRADSGEAKYYSVDEAELRSNPMLAALKAKKASDEETNNAISDLILKTDALTITSNRIIKDQVSRLVPTIVYGSQATGIINATLTSQHIPLLSTVQMMSAGKQNTIHPNGEGAGGVPLQIIPATLNMTTYGCPLIALAQLYFIDFNTGTTADNLYILTHLSHAFAPGKFESSWQLSYADGYGRYKGAQSLTKGIQQIVDGQQEKPDQTKNTTSKR